MPKHKHPTSFIICMEGQINGQAPGTMFCDSFYGKKQNTLLEDVVKTNKGAYATLQFKALSKINQNIKMDKNWANRAKPSQAAGEKDSGITEAKKNKGISHQKAKN